MALTINTNLMAGNSARMLNQHFSKLATSTQRLSSGLRVNSAADDAAGLAVREMMRSDIATLGQGIRNANDAISMIQTADGALAVIDEKLIRMKELAEQASTGTYNSVQRMIIDSEFQAMASEITRIANATTFNGIHLLDGTLNGEHDGTKLQATGSAKIHFGTGNDSAEDYYYVKIPDSTFPGLLGYQETTGLTLSPISAAFDNTPSVGPFGFADTERTQAILLDDGNVMVMQSANTNTGLPGAGWGTWVSTFDPGGRLMQGPRLVPELGATGFNALDCNDIAALPGGGAATLQFEWGNPTGDNDSLVLTVLNNNLNATAAIDLGVAAGGINTDRTRAASVASSGANVAVGWSCVDGNSIVSFVDTAVVPLTPTPLPAIPNSIDVNIENVGGNFLVSWFDRVVSPPLGTITRGNQRTQLYSAAGTAIGSQQNLGPLVSGSIIALDASRLARTWSAPAAGGGGNVTMMQVWNVDSTTGVVTQGATQAVGAPLTPGVSQQSTNLTQLYNPDGTLSNDVMVTWTERDIATGATMMYAKRTPISGNTVIPSSSPAMLVDKGINSGTIGYVPSLVGTRDGNFLVNWKNSRGTAPWADDRNAVRVFSATPVVNILGRTRRHGLSVETQQKAQDALGVLDGAIATKDTTRAHLGALQNRLENTITNLQTQAENLQAAESRISDTDVATEMTYFVRQQILTQGAIAMLSQANSLPKMAMNIIGG